MQFLYSNFRGGEHPPTHLLSSPLYGDSFLPKVTPRLTTRRNIVGFLMEVYYIRTGVTLYVSYTWSGNTFGFNVHYTSFLPVVLYSKMADLPVSFLSLL